MSGGRGPAARRRDRPAWLRGRGGEGAADRPTIGQPSAHRARKTVRCAVVPSGQQRRPPNGCPQRDGGAGTTHLGPFVAGPPVDRATPARRQNRYHLHHRPLLRGARPTRRRPGSNPAQGGDRRDRSAAGATVGPAGGAAWVTPAGLPTGQRPGACHATVRRPPTVAGQQGADRPALEEGSARRPPGNRTVHGPFYAALSTGLAMVMV